jgi:hypothetical protein
MENSEKHGIVYPMFVHKRILQFLCQESHYSICIPYSKGLSGNRPMPRGRGVQGVHSIMDNYMTYTVSLF